MLLETVTDAVLEAVDVKDGVDEGVAVIDDVRDAVAVTDGVREAIGVTDGVFVLVVVLVEVPLTEREKVGEEVEETDTACVPDTVLLGVFVPETLNEGVTVEDVVAEPVGVPFFVGVTDDVPDVD